MREARVYPGLAALIRGERMRRGMTQHQFSELTRIARGTLAHWEAARNNPTIDAMQSLAKWLCISIVFNAAEGPASVGVVAIDRVPG